MVRKINSILRINIINYVLIIVVVCIGIYSIYLAFINTDAYMQLIDEDGVVEYSSAIFWFLSAINCLICLFITRKDQKLNKFVYLLFILFFIICGGEEISWGQRLLNYDTPYIFQLLNKQNEANIHDIGSISVFANTFFIGTIIFFLLIPFLSQRNITFNKWLNDHNFPKVNPIAVRIYIISLIIWIVIGIRFGTLGFHPFTLWGYYTQMDDEIFEFLAAYSFFSFTVLDLAFRIKNKKVEISKLINSQEE